MTGPNLLDDKRVGATARIVDRPGKVRAPADPGPDLEPAGRKRAQVRHVEIGQKNLTQGSRYRCSRHQQHMR